MKLPVLSFILGVMCLISCQTPPNQTTSQSSSYLDYSQKKDQYTGGITMIPIKTPVGDFKVWTKRVGNNPKMKVLLLHGGPGATHELYSCFDGYFPKEEIEYIYYDQLGSHYSDQPTDSALWTIDRFVEEVEQVRIALDLDQDNFYLLSFLIFTTTLS